MRRSPPFGTLTLALVLLLGAHLAGAAPAPPTAAELAGHVVAPTPPKVEGRAEATGGGERAARYLESSLAALGLRPGGDGGTWRQSFVVRRGVRVVPDSALARTGAAPLALALGQDWTPHGGSQPGEVEAELVFAGRGEDFAGVDARGKIALVLDGGSSRLEKLIAARHAGAAAVLIAAAGLPSLEATLTHVAIPSVTLTPGAVDALLAPIGWSHAALVQALATPSGPTAAGFATGVRLRLAIRLEAVDRRADNVIGILPGTDPALRDEAVVIGAHYDHLGRIGGAVYPGADDNASGTAVVLGLARAFAAAGGAPRTLIFALFSGEEIGLLGSAHYVRHPAIPLERTIAMVNFDMVGRMRDGRASVSGVESAAGLRALVTTAAAGEGLDLTLRDSPYGPSDHARFYGAGVPVVFFSTGVHEDYHKRTDTADRLNMAGMTQIGAVAVRLVDGLAGAPRPIYARVAPSAGRRQPEASGAQPASGAFLGVSLDAMSASDGLRLGAIVPGSGAERAGLREGDVLVRLGDTGINGFDDLRSVLARQAPGDTVRVVYLRDGQDHAASVTLGTRP
jgi:Peptidase family M28/PDZ domain/PA domain